jgi:peptidoglycan/xylan/chitin deacetylase (PgdA/CDA1 family)
MRQPGPKQIVRGIAHAAVRFSGAAFLARHTIQANRVTVLAYHDPDPVTFERHMALLSSLYSIIPLGSLLEALRSGDFTKLPQRALLVTLDDGWAGNARLLPSLLRHGVRPTIFLSTAIVGTHRHFWWTPVPDPGELERLKSVSTQERLRDLAAAGTDPGAEYPDREALSLEEVAQLARGVDFGAHSRSHPILPNSPDADAEREIVGSAEDVERLTGTRATAFSYPNGDHSPREIELVRRAGCECAFTVEPGYVTAASDPYLLRRFFVNEKAGVTELISAASGVYGVAFGILRSAFGGPVERRHGSELPRRTGRP